MCTIIYTDCDDHAKPGIWALRIKTHVWLSTHDTYWMWSAQNRSCRPVLTRSNGSEQQLPKTWWSHRKARDLNEVKLTRVCIGTVWKRDKEEIHMCWNVLNDDEMHPPIHTEYLRSGGATTLIFIVEGARALSSLVMRSPIAANLKGSAPARYAQKQHVSLLWYQN